MPTIKDIAREAGVSHGTVSNVLNKTGKVSIEKIRLVENAAKKLGYVPNTQAQMLRQGTPHTVALILPSLCEDIYLDLYNALQVTLFEAEYDLIIYQTDDIASNEEQILKRIPQSNLIAVVAVSCLAASGNELYTELPCPVIYIDREKISQRPNDMFIRFDYREIGIAIGRRILAQKQTRIAVFSDSPVLFSSSQLMAGLNEVLGGTAVSVSHYVSSLNLAINKAFDIAQSGIPFDLIITSSTSRADAVATALKCSCLPRRPEILTLSSLTYLPSPNYLTYQMDYSQMGVRIANLIIGYSQRKEPLPSAVTMTSKGFPAMPPLIRKKTDQTLTMLTLDTPSTRALEKLLPMFEISSGIHVQILRTPSEDLYSRVNMLNEDFSYDLIRMDTALMDTLAAKAYMPLAEAGITSGILPWTLVQNNYHSYSVVDGTMYTLPFDPSVQILLYRRDLFGDALLKRAYFERYHESLAVPATISQYLRTAEFFTRSSNPDSPVPYGATIADNAAAFIASDFLPYYIANISAEEENKDRCFQTSAMEKAMEQYIQMTHYAARSISWPDCIRLLTDETAAMTTVYSNYASGVINSRYSNMVGKIGATVIPGGHPLLGGGVIGICRYSKKAEACRQFLSWYYTLDISSMIVRLGGTSPLADGYNNFKNFNNFPWLSAVKKSFDLGVRSAGSPEPIHGLSIRTYEFCVGTAIKDLMSGNISRPDAIRTLRTMLTNNVGRTF